MTKEMGISIRQLDFSKFSDPIIRFSARGLRCS
jgi:hypothetical protein